MVNYNLNLLRKISIISILFFLFSILFFIYTYSSFEINTSEKIDLNNIKANIISLNEDLKYQKQKYLDLKISYIQIQRDYNILLNEQAKKNSSKNSVSTKIVNLNSDVFQIKRNIEKLNIDINILKGAIG